MSIEPSYRRNSSMPTLNKRPSSVATDVETAPNTPLQQSLLSVKNRVTSSRINLKSPQSLLSSVRKYETSPKANRTNGFFTEDMKIGRTASLSTKKISATPKDLITKISNFYSGNQINDAVNELPTVAARVEFLDLIMQRRQELDELKNKLDLEAVSPIIQRFQQKFKLRTIKKYAVKNPANDNEKKKKQDGLHHELIFKRDSVIMGEASPASALTKNFSNDSSPQARTPVPPSRFSYGSDSTTPFGDGSPIIVAPVKEAKETPRTSSMGHIAETEVPSQKSLNLQCTPTPPTRGTFALAAFAGKRDEAPKHQQIRELEANELKKIVKPSTRTPPQNSPLHFNFSHLDHLSPVDKGLLAEKASTYTQKLEKHLQDKQEAKGRKLDFLEQKKRPQIKIEKHPIRKSENDAAVAALLEKDLLRFAVKNQKNISKSRELIFNPALNSVPSLRFIEEKAERKFDKFIKEKKYFDSYSRNSPENTPKRKQSPGSMCYASCKNHHYTEWPNYLPEFSSKNKSRTLTRPEDNISEHSGSTMDLLKQANFFNTYSNVINNITKTIPSDRPLEKQSPAFNNLKRVIPERGTNKPLAYQKGPTKSMDFKSKVNNQRRRSIRPGQIIVPNTYNTGETDDESLISETETKLDYLYRATNELDLHINQIDEKLRSCSDKETQQKLHLLRQKRAKAHEENMKEIYNITDKKILYKNN